MFDPTLGEELTEIVANNGITAAQLLLEITESAYTDNSQQISAAVSTLRSAGFKIEMDDFGSGYSSLNHLIDYDFDVLKLDLEFLRTYDKHPQAGRLINHIVQWSIDLGAIPLQEGVETKEHLDFLKSIHCNCAQGYYFAKPLPMDKSRELTRSKNLTWE
jgi:EAL domain-containing protein (putative c-di-GMP-specific phosphodiesterase class I)